MQKTLATGTVTVPVPDHETLRAIIRQSEVARSDFESLLED